MRGQVMECRPFERLTPAIIRHISGELERRAPQGRAPSVEEPGLCRDFVIAAAPRVAEHQP